jgi:hypothetical protein
MPRRPEAIFDIEPLIDARSIAALLQDIIYGDSDGSKASACSATQSLNLWMLAKIMDIDTVLIIVRLILTSSRALSFEELLGVVETHIIGAGVSERAKLHIPFRILGRPGGASGAGAAASASNAVSAAAAVERSGRRWYRHNYLD